MKKVNNVVIVMICYYSWKMYQIYEHITQNKSFLLFFFFVAASALQRKRRCNNRDTPSDPFLSQTTFCIVASHEWNEWNLSQHPVIRFCLHAHNFLHCSYINWHIKSLFPPSPHCLDNEQMINTYWSLFHSRQFSKRHVSLFRNDIITFSQWPWKEPPT